MQMRVVKEKHQSWEKAMCRTGGGQTVGGLPGVPLRACAMVSFSWGARQSQLVSLAKMAGSVRVWDRERPGYTQNERGRLIIVISAPKACGIPLQGNTPIHHFSCAQHASLSTPFPLTVTSIKLLITADSCSLLGHRSARQTALHSVLSISECAWLDIYFSVTCV